MDVSRDNLSSSFISTTANCISTDLSGELVILNLTDGVYYGLTEVGASVWGLIASQPMLIDEICEAIVREYAVEPDVCRGDILELLCELQSRSLIEVRDAAKD
ncbi:MAG: PqqD family protein [Capsulimonadaceae bacterium]